MKHVNKGEKNIMANRFMTPEETGKIIARRFSMLVDHMEEFIKKTAPNLPEAEGRQLAHYMALTGLKEEGICLLFGGRSK